MNRKSLYMAVFLIGVPASAEMMPSADKTVNRTLPEEPGFKNDTEYKKRFEEMRKQLDALQSNQESAQRTLQAAGTGLSPAAAATNPVTIGSVGAVGSTANASSLIKGSGAKHIQSRFSRKSSKGGLWLTNLNSSDDAGIDPELNPATGAQIFAVSEAANAASDDTMTVLPVGSFVKAKVISGVEANTLEPYPVLLQLSYAFTGPNKTRIDLSNCFVIAKARANLSTERVIMETDTISCVRDNGEYFKTTARGYTAGEDSTFGSTGTFISKQGQVLLAAVLANIAKNAGEAISLAQQSTTLLGADKAATATNVTGSKAGFVAGKSMVDASSLIAQWYLDYAKQLIPSIGIGSGQDVHIIMLESVRVPSLKE